MLSSGMAQMRISVAASLLGVSDVSLWVSYTLMIGFVVALGALGLWLLKKGVGLRS